jgi:protein-ribulosamine 3-kinase
MDITWDAIAQRISAATGTPFAARARDAVGGGCINSATVLQDGRQRYFVKLNDAARLAMFEAEAEGLKAIAQTRSVRVPRPVCAGTAGGCAYLVLEHLDLESADARSLERLGYKNWRRCTAPRRTIRLASRQHHRLDAAGQHARQRLGGVLARTASRVSAAARRPPRPRPDAPGRAAAGGLGDFFRSYHPAPSLLHGDLWGGNVGACDGQPVIFDPAVYYGDREADIAMTELFGGFSARFYRAYEEAWPLDAGYKVRKTLYNLYHILNHFNLFGGGYGSQAERMMDSLLSELG